MIEGTTNGSHLDVIRQNVLTDMAIIAKISYYSLVWRHSTKQITINEVSRWWETQIVVLASN